MSLRNVCVISLHRGDVDQILLFRTFPTVEKRYKIWKGDKYIPLPSTNAFVTNLLIKLRLLDSSEQFVEWRDKSNKAMQLPVVEVHVGNQEIWPVVAIVQKPFLVCCLPYAEVNSEEDKENLLQYPSVSVGFSVLLGILNVLRISTSSEKMALLIELESFLTLSLPFGTPSDVELSALSYVQNVHPNTFSKRQPAWKPFDYKGKQQIHLNIHEFVRSMQCDNHESMCYFEVYGQVTVKADLEGTTNDVTLSVSGTDTFHPLVLDSLLVHPCVQMLSGPSVSVPALLRRLRFSPPLHEFILFQYCSPEPKEPPILGVFKMLGENSVELLMQLKLNDKIKNSFEFCDVIVVFSNRGPVKNMEFNINHGSARLSDDKHTLKWNVGTKFPKDLEAVMSAKLDFHSKPILQNSDPFCVGKNCYAEVSFKQNNTTLSGCNVDPKTVSISQGNKAKIVIDRSIQSTEYRIWNNYGDLPFPVNILNKYEKLFD